MKGTSAGAQAEIDSDITSYRGVFGALEVEIALICTDRFRPLAYRH